MTCNDIRIKEMLDRGIDMFKIPFECQSCCNRRREYCEAFSNHVWDAHKLCRNAKFKPYKDRRKVKQTGHLIQTSLRRY